MVKVSGAELDFYRNNHLRVGVCLADEEEFTGYVQEYSIRNFPPDNGHLQLGDLPHEQFELNKHLGNSTGYYRLISLGKIKSLEAAAIKDINSSSLPDESRREVLRFLVR